MISYVIPTRQRPARLRATLHAIDALGPHDAEVIVVDNASPERAILPTRLESGVPVRSLWLDRNLGAAARNAGASESDPRSGWLVMLDDDSFPVGRGHLEAIDDAEPGVVAIAADIFLAPSAKLDRGASSARYDQRDAAPARESGGLPEVFIGCGVAIRRDAFLAHGGYDESFQYYAEEYDLAARILLAGGRVAFDPRFVVHHAKDPARRDMDLIVERLVRNNGWVARRYSPDEERAAILRDVRRRYRRIAQDEGALAGYARGLVALRRSIRAQPRTPMARGLFDRFTGLAHARVALALQGAGVAFRRAAMVDAGKNAWAVQRALVERGVSIVPDPRDAEAIVVATMSPGPMLDSARRRRAQRRGRGPVVVVPWVGAMGTAEHGARPLEIAPGVARSAA